MRQRRLRRGFLLVIFIAALFVSGCWDRRELNELSIAVGMGLDLSESGIEVTAQVVNPGEVVARGGSTGYSTPVTTLSAIDKTTFEALRKLNTLAPRKIYTSHLRVLVIGERLARHGLNDVLDGVSRDREFRSDFYLIVAKGTTAKNVLSILTPMEKIPANKMFITLGQSHKYWAPTVKVQLDDFMSDEANPVKSMVLTGLEVVGNSEKGRTKRNESRSTPYALLNYSGVGLFKGGKLVDWLGEEESKGYNYIMDNVYNTAGHISCPGGKELGVEVIRAKATKKGKVEGGRPEITVRLFVEENISEVRCKIDLTKQQNIVLLEQLGEDKLEGILMSVIRKAQANKADIFGFGEAVEDANPRAWKAMEDKWPEYFAKLDVKVEVDVQIRKLGTTSNSILERGE